MNFYQDELLKQMLEELLREPYAKVCFFRFKNLETIAEEVCQASEILSSQHPLFSSFEKSKSLLCLILSYLEVSGFSDLPKGAIASLDDSHSLTSSEKTFTSLISILSDLREQKQEAFSEQVSISIIGLSKLEKSFEEALDCLRQLKSKNEDETLAA